MTDTGAIETSHGKIAYAQSRADGPAILLIHGNSSCKEVFSGQLGAPGLAGWRVVALDLDGAAHAPFLQQPETFNGLLARFAANA